ncbi:MAG: VPLPA-CTERM-specific exosortase XrtD [Gammaproteobacteria bacterium]
MNSSEVYWKNDTRIWAASITLVGATSLLYWDALTEMVGYWSNRDEYSHGFLIPVITLYLVWQRFDRLRELRFDGSWGGVALAVFGLAGYVLGELSTLYSIIQYSFVLFVMGCVWAVVGTAAFRVVFIPLCLLFFMVPFPNFIYNNLSTKLQLISSAIGVGVIRLFGISVYLEGNVIDLGSYKLQVVEACNGLRYLFPLMTLGVIVAYFYHAALWKRLLVFASTVPITILMNSFRIGVIGVMVEHWGQSMAEGFLHDFEGWVIFMACFGILFVEMWLLMRLSNDRRPLGQVFGIDPPIAPDPERAWKARTLNNPAIALVLIVSLSVVPAMQLADREEDLPDRKEFAQFPDEIGAWKGRSDRLEQHYLDILKLSDYVMANFRLDETGVPINFYVAWYDSQKKGQSVHSPATCLPGGGWEIESMRTVEIPGVQIAGEALRVNRVQIALGESRQLVYYWFQQRGRVITSQYAAKWYIFWDALTRNRTDGALVRIIAPARPGQDIAELDKKLSEFAADVVPLLEDYVPN